MFSKNKINLLLVYNNNNFNSSFFFFKLLDPNPQFNHKNSNTEDNNNRNHHDDHSKLDALSNLINWQINQMQIFISTLSRQLQLGDKIIITYLKKYIIYDIHMMINEFS
jgi:hypothetical protein